LGGGEASITRKNRTLTEVPNGKKLRKDFLSTKGRDPNAIDVEGNFLLHQAEGEKARLLEEKKVVKSFLD